MRWCLGFLRAKAENPETETIDPDTIVIPSDAQSKQLLDLEVEDAAIEDTIYELGKAYERADEVVSILLTQLVWPWGADHARLIFTYLFNNFYARFECWCCLDMFGTCPPGRLAAHFSRDVPRPLSTMHD